MKNMPNEMYLKGVKFAIREIMNLGLLMKEDKKTIDANIILQAFYNNAVDFCDYGSAGLIRYYEWDKKHKPTKAVYYGGSLQDFKKEARTTIINYLMNKEV